MHKATRGEFDETQQDRKSRLTMAGSTFGLVFTVIAIASTLQVTEATGRLVSRSTSSLVLTAEPEEIREGFDPTPSLTVTCTYTGTTQVSSMRLYKSSLYRTDSVVASVLSTSVRSVTKGSWMPAGGTATSRPHGTSIRTLIVTILNPGRSAAGKYYCVITPWWSSIIRYVKDVYVKFIPFDVQDFVQRFLELKECVDELKADSGGGGINTTIVQNLQGQIDALELENDNLTRRLGEAETCIDELKDDVQTLQTLVNSNTDRLDTNEENIGTLQTNVASNTIHITTLKAVTANLTADLDEAEICIDDLKATADEVRCRIMVLDDNKELVRDSLFVMSDVFENSTYLMSTYSPASFNQAEALCVSNGGILAEINNQTEFDFISSFVSQYMSKHQYLLFGAMFTTADKIYRNRASGSEEVFLNFFPGRPNDPYNEQCVALVLNRFDVPGLMMDDVRCDCLTDPEVNHGFICEIPVVEEEADTCAPVTVG